MTATRPKSRRTVLGFRIVLMLSLLGAVAVVAGLYMFGAAGAARPRKSATDAPSFQVGTRMIGKDFDYTFSQGAKTVFRVRGDSLRVDKDDTVFLENVGVTLYDKEGRQFDAESDSGSINRNSNEGELWGEVSMKGPAHLEIYTRRLLIQQKGNLLATPGLARILYAEKYYGRCDALQAWLPDEVFSMFGNVRIETVPAIKPPVLLEADRAVYERKRRQLHAEGQAELHRGTEQIHADRLSGMLSENESSLTFVRALYNVIGETAPADAKGVTRISWAGNDLAVMLTPKGNLVRQVNLDGGADKPANLRSEAKGVMRNLVAPHIEGLLADRNILRSAKAFEGVDIQETDPPAAAGASKGSPPPAGAPKGSAAAAGAPKAAPAPAGAVARPGAGTGPGAAPGGAAMAAATPGATAGGAAGDAEERPADRHAHGQRADATFRPDGQIATVTLLDHVTYSDAEVNAAGDRAVMDMDAGHGDFYGNPVDVLSARGKMRAPHVIYTSADQLMHAVDGVHAQIEQSNDAALAGSVLGEGKGPVMVQSQEAYWRRPQASFIFRGEVRAWRGDNLLLSPELIGERLAQGDQLIANNGVKTVWMPSQSEGGTAGKPAAGSPAAKAAAAKPAAGTRAPPAAGKGKLAGANTGLGISDRGGPITVLATNMLYRDGTGVLTYKGNVHVDQDTKTLTCEQLDVYVDQNHKARQMICIGQTHLDDPAAGRKIDGDSAIYRIEIRKIDILGDPVVMHDKDGNIIHGRRLRYSIDDGKVQVLGKDDGPQLQAAPTLSTPPAAPAAPAQAAPQPAAPVGKAAKPDGAAATPGGTAGSVR
jgi:lipopolysaccharide transport protein LptA